MQSNSTIVTLPHPPYFTHTHTHRFDLVHTTTVYPGLPLSSSKISLPTSCHIYCVITLSHEFSLPFPLTPLLSYLIFSLSCPTLIYTFISGSCVPEKRPCLANFPSLDDFCFQLFSYRCPDFIFLRSGINFYCVYVYFLYPSLY